MYKRKGGQQIGNDLLVMTESTKIEFTENWVHNCGSLLRACYIRRVNSITGDIMQKEVPYCPKCEEQPK